MRRTTPNNNVDHTYQWKCSDSVLSLDPNRPLIMGILNVTPDSFSDGGRHNKLNDAVEYAEYMIAEGADIIDIGGESTRPGADPVSVEEEIARTVPVVNALADMDALISIDTMKSEVAAAATEAGARIINDVSACTADPEMVNVVAGSSAGIVLMHMLGDPRTMQENPQYEDVVAEITENLAARADDLVNAGVSRESIVLDPGIGFGKTVEHNLQLLAGITRMSRLGFPLLVGLSRKSFIGKITGRDINERLAGTLAGLVWCIMKGVHILRVHDVPEAIDAVNIIKAIREVDL